MDDKNMVEIIEKLKKGEIKPYQLEEMMDPRDAVEVRRKYIEEVTGVKLKHVGRYSIDEKEAIKKNIENMIGAIQIPLGFAGPLKINGKYAKGEFYIPLSTTEGALVASVNRGCSVINRCGGCTVRVIDNKMTRAPVFKTSSVVEAIKLKNWILENFHRIKEVAESTTKHGKLISIHPIMIVGRYVYPRFTYTTGDAMGMNMVTIATEKACEFIEEEVTKEENCGINVHTVALSGNFCTDKKPSGVNMVEGRGKTIVAEVFLKEDVVRRYLKTTSKAIEQVNLYKNLIGSAASNSMGFNAHYANIIGAIFLATGQDEAHIVEGSIGITVAEAEENGLYFSVTLPDVPLGTVGGGTRVETQKECLEMLGCSGSGKALKFAEIVGGAVLAGELSLLGALASGHLARAHMQLGR
ncbi:MAG TPA: hydroxymethylglutaryl-CoA reductase (NADPH) [Methanothermococcus okinawensis]|uniref:3-hydroxy-3-methylglutaryl coenzyme A reductase n=1 Tax=Methanofervidicoccus abyssi TaxID=2082189 RepID=A0A401HPQ7_9EURY|nr:hydroxymethylglutaryl-CoA reductase (NADPH) [Methanofervidicoccus abyssi]GBF36238.1 hydroxymethylglutaryl-CoA reductase (NADPH) [Methanofervidicoccus abyssi]HIP16535.1 hydroxymethylglutaryl-CoA reductase (NADPH) [Methanothermococcus okinawensis]